MSHLEAGGKFWPTLLNLSPHSPPTPPHTHLYIYTHKSTSQVDLPTVFHLCGLQALLMAEQLWIDSL